MNVFYGLVTAGVLAPAVAAVAQSSGQEVFGQLAALLGGVGVNLVSNLIQQIKDRSEEDAAAEVQRQYEADPELRKALDTLIEKLDAINTAQRTLSDADREWFVQTLREELRQAGSTIINITIIQPDPGVQSLHQLPDPPADFIGRAAELDKLCANARSCGVLISGTGGVGKTALGLVLAHRLRDAYPDAQLFLNLQGASDHPLTPAEALERLIRAFEPTARLPETVDELKVIYTSLLQGKRVLVFLDDAMDAAQVRPLLPPQPCLGIVTSRHRLVLASLHTTDVEALPPEDADRLICTVWGKTGEVRALAKQCGRLPMALRAVGALLRRRPDLSVAKVRQLLESAAERLKLADPERESTVAAAFQASYDLLDPALQTRWRELGIFPADFDTPAAAAVWGMDGDAGAVLAELYDACLVDYVRDRWRLHDLGRDFTRALWTVEEGDALAVRHAFWYFQILGQASELYQAGGDSVLAGLGLFDRERQNVEAGQAWAAARAGQNREIARLCNAYPDAGVHVISLRLHPRAQVAWLEAALAAARSLGDREAEGANLGNLGSAYLNLGEAQKAISYYEQALAIFHRLSNWHGEGAILGNLGSAYFSLGEIQKAIGYFEQSLAICRETGDLRGQGNSLGRLGNAYYGLGEIQRAIGYFEQALVIHRELGDRRGEGADLGNLGVGYADLGEVRKAIGYYEEALKIAREIGDRSGEGNALTGLGNAYARLGETHNAIDYYEQALVIATETGDQSAKGADLGNLGIAYASLGDASNAIRYHEQALVTFRSIGNRRGEAITSWNLGLIYEKQGDLEHAVEWMQARVDYERATGHPEAENYAARVEEIRRRMTGG